MTATTTTDVELKEKREEREKNTLSDVIASISDFNARMQFNNHIVPIHLCIFFVLPPNGIQDDAVDVVDVDVFFVVLKEMESIFIGTLTAIDFVQLSFYVFDMSHGFETIVRVHMLL